MTAIATMILYGSTGSQATVYDLSSDFSPTNNPNGVWSYGAKATIDGPLSVFGVRGLNPFEYWQLVPGQEPTIYRNGTSNTITVGEHGVYPPGVVFLFGGFNGSSNGFGAIRFTVPPGASGDYLVKTDVRPVYDGPPQGDTDFHVIKNGVEVFGQFLAPTNRSGYTNTLTLAAGDTVEFLVGRGGDNDNFGSGLKIRATITSIDTPQPPVSLKYDLGRDFALVNPNGVWSYGYQSAIGAQFNSLSSPQVFSSDNGLPILLWHTKTAPAIYANTNNAVVMSGGETYPSHTAWCYAGPEGSDRTFAAMRFTVPVNGAGVYRIASAVSPRISSGGDDSDFHVARNGVELFGQFLGATDSGGYTNDVTLQVGDTVDFLVGRGANGTLHGSGLKIQATITLQTNAPPEPPSGLMVNGSFELGVDPGISADVSAPNSTTITGWTVENASVDYIGTRWIAGDGVRCLDLSGTDAGTISQVINGLTPGQAYRLSFLMAGNPEVGLALARLRAGVGTTSGEFSFSPSGFTPANMGWAEKSLDFVAAAASEKLSFISLNPGWAGAALDQVAIVAVTNVPPEPPVSVTYNLGRDFDLTNPNGVWSYGYQSAIGAPLNLLSTQQLLSSDHGLPILLWHTGTAPAIYGNTNDTTVVSGGEAYPPHIAWCYAGPEGTDRTFAVMRFTVPANGAGVYRVASAVSPRISSGGDDSDFHVARNGVELFGQFLGATESGGFTNSVALQAGDTIDFLVGRGANGRLSGSGLRVHATIVLVTNIPPEPPISVSYNLGRDFALMNPNGVWSYGYQAAIGEPLNLLSTQQLLSSDHGLPVLLWHTGTAPAIYGNTNDTTVVSGGEAYPPHIAWCYAGPEGTDRTFAVMRFTVPVNGAGIYRVASAVSPRISSGGDDSDFHVVKNGVELFGQFLGAMESGGYTNDVVLQAGDTIDFLVGRGANGRLAGSGLKIQATITLQTNAPPEPPAGLVVNGSFELGIEPDVQIDAPNSTAITGWTVQSGNIDYVGAGWMAGDGNRSLDLSGTTVGTISQVIAGLTPGQSYRLSFLMAGNPGLIPPFPAVKRLRASMGSASQEYSFNATGRSANNMGWTEKVLDFTADGSSMTLLFTSLTDGLGGAALDKVTIVLVTNIPPEPPISVTYNLGRDFALVNPNGVWSYGYQSAIGAQLNLLANAQTVTADNAVPILLWHTQGAPAIYANTNDTAVVSGGETYPPHTAWCYAGPEGSDRTFAVARFTVPSGGSGLYRIASAVSPRISSGGDDSDYHVAKNGVEIFGQLLGATESGGYTNAVALQAGDTVDFLVGRGANNRLFGSGLKIQATISLQTNAPPEPPSGFVVNGSFELGLAPDVQVDAPNSTAITGWTVQSGSIDYVRAGWMAGDGNRSLDMSGAAAGTISQVIGGLTAGQAYRLSFLMAGNPGLIPPLPAIKQLRASIGAASQEYSFNASGHSANNMDWTEKVLNFTADGSSMTLLFTSLTDGLGGAALDKVAINLQTNAPPEPPSGFVVNGSFELGLAPDVQVDAPNSTAITGWTVQSGSIDYVGAGWMAGDGNRSLDMSGATAGTISQVIGGLTAGQAYRLSFLMAGNPGLIPPLPAVKRLRASIGGASQEYSFDASGHSANNMGWTEKVLDFTADGSSMTLLFTSLTDGLGGAALDKVTIMLVTNIPPEPPISVTYNLGRDFALVNPNGVWSYGYQSAIGGQLNLLNSQQTVQSDNGLPILLWHTQTAPAIYANTNNTAVVSGGETHPPHTAWCYAGPEGSDRTFAVARFTVPSGGGGLYRIASAVSPRISSGGDDSDYHVAKNGVEIFGQLLGATESGGYTNAVALQAGDTVDFLVGRGANDRLFGSGLKLQVAINFLTNTPPEPPISVTYDLSDDFSPTNNPNGPWTYGWQGSLGGAFSALPAPVTSRADGGVPIPAWQLTAFQTPGVYKNTSGSAISIGGVISLPAGTVWCSPGPRNHAENFCVIRFTAPSSGAYRIETAVAPFYNGPPQTDADFHVLKNGVELFGRFLSPSEAASFVETVTLASGDTVDFAIGRGADSGSILRIRALLTLVATPVNHAPVAVIRSEQLIELKSEYGNPVLLSCNWWSACLVADGWTSSDPEGGELIYVWSLENDPVPFGVGPLVTNCLEVGQHTILLTVTDPAGLQGIDRKTIEVVTAPSAIDLLIEEITESHKSGVLLSRKTRRELIGTLQVALEHAGDEELRATQKALDAFAKKVRAQVADQYPDAAATWIRWSQAVSEGMENCVNPPRKDKDHRDDSDGTKR